MCRAGGPRCTGEISRRLKSAKSRLERVQAAVKAGTRPEADLEKAKRRAAAANEAYSVTTAHERQLRSQADDLKRRAKQALEDGNKRKATRLENKANRIKLEADYVRADRLAHRAAARDDSVKVEDPDTGETVVVSRRLLETAANARNAYETQGEPGGHSVVPGFNGNFQDVNKTFAAGSVSELKEAKLKAKADRDAHIAAKGKLEGELSKLNQQPIPENDAEREEHEQQIKALRAEIKDHTTSAKVAATKYVGLVAATSGTDMIRDGKLPRRDAGVAARAAAFDTIDANGNKGRGIKINARNSKRPDSFGYKPKGGSVLPGSVRTAKMVVHNNGEVIDGQVRVNAVRLQNGSYAVYQTIDGKSAHITSNNCMQSHAVGELATNRSTSKGRIRQTLCVGNFTSKKAAMRAVASHCEQLSVDPNAPKNADVNPMSTAVGQLIAVTEANKALRLRRKKVVHPHLKLQNQYEVDGVTY